MSKDLLYKKWAELKIGKACFEDMGKTKDLGEHSEENLRLKLKYTGELFDRETLSKDEFPVSMDFDLELTNSALLVGWGSEIVAQSIAARCLLNPQDYILAYLELEEGDLTWGAHQSERKPPYFNSISARRLREYGVVASIGGEQSNQILDWVESEVNRRKELSSQEKTNLLQFVLMVDLDGGEDEVVSSVLSRLNNLVSDENVKVVLISESGPEKVLEKVPQSLKENIVSIDKPFETDEFYIEYTNKEGAAKKGRILQHALEYLDEKVEEEIGGDIFQMKVDGLLASQDH